MKIVSIILIVLSVFILIGGMSSATGAPQEAAIAGICCFLGILARIAQAQAHHETFIKQKAEEKQLMAAPPPSSFIKT